jgi:gluconolactonase
MKTLLITAGLPMMAASVQAQQALIALGAKWEKVSGAGLGTAEGVTAARDGSIYVTDLNYAVPNSPGGTIYRYDPRTGQTTKEMEPSGMANGLTVAPNGDLIIAQSANGGKQALAQWDLKTKNVTMLVDRFEGKRLIAPNDLVFDGNGRLYFTDARYFSPEIPELPNSVYRLDPDGKLVQLDTGMLRPNGIEVSPDSKRLYVANTVFSDLRPNPHGPASDRFGMTAGGIVAFDLSADGSISGGQVLWRTDRTYSDGTAMDTEGNVYVASTNHTGINEVVAIAPSGKVLQEFPPPEAGSVVQLGFGRGDDASTLYLSTRAPWGLWRIKTTKTGFYRN